MKKRIITSITIVAALVATTAFAQVPPTVPIQGVLTDSDGAPLDGDQIVRFRLYDAAEDGTVLHDETQPLTVTGGTFSAYLGTTTAIDVDLFDGADIWLGLTVGTDDEMMPRFAFGSVPYAMTSAKLGDLGPGDVALAGHAHDATEVSTGVLSEDRYSSYADLTAEGYLDAADATDLLTRAQSESRFAATTHSHSAGEITGGTLDPARYSCYADLSAEGYLDGAQTTDLLTRAVGDTRYAPTAHGHSATDITSGTLASARFSAYGDLSADGYLNNNSSTDLLTRGQADARYFQTQNWQIFTTATANQGSIRTATGGTGWEFCMLTFADIDWGGYCQVTYNSSSGVWQVTALATGNINGSSARCSMLCVNLN